MADYDMMFRTASFILIVDYDTMFRTTDVFFDCLFILRSGWI